MGDALMRAFLRVGLAPQHMYLLTVPGRRTGKLYSTPADLVEDLGGRYLVAPYGERAGRRTRAQQGLSSFPVGGRASAHPSRHATPEGAAPILREYARAAAAPRPHFDATRDSPVEEFETEADRHPVFRLGPSS